MTAGPLPQINQDLCTGCGKCVDVCPTATLGLIAVGSAAGQEVLKAVLSHPERCTYCLACEEICPVNAIALPFQIVIARPQGGQER
jgi:ferredoxin